MRKSREGKNGTKDEDEVTTPLKAAYDRRDTEFVELSGVGRTLEAGGVQVYEKDGTAEGAGWELEGSEGREGRRGGNAREVNWMVRGGRVGEVKR